MTICSAIALKWIKTRGLFQVLWTLWTVHENKNSHYYFKHNDSLDADHVASVGVGEDLEDEGAEGLVAGLGHDVGHVGGDGLEQDLGLRAGVSAHKQENMVMVQTCTSETILHREYIF